MSCLRITSEGSCQPRCPPRGRRTRYGRKQLPPAPTRFACVTSAEYSGYDICDTTACQVYGGMGRETSNGNAAVRATAGTIVTYRGKVALTQFASSNGGYSARGDYPYLAAHRDPYDGVIKSQAWTRVISATSISRAWPSVGTVKQLQITSRDGAGAWGGRVKTIKIIGTSRTATVSGTTFQHMFGMRSSLYMVAGSSTPVAAAAARGPSSKSRVRHGLSSKSRRSARPVVQKPSETWPVAHQPSATYPTLPGRYPAPASLSNADRSAE